MRSIDNINNSELSISNAMLLLLRRTLVHFLMLFGKFEPLRRKDTKGRKVVVLVMTFIVLSFNHLYAQTRTDISLDKGWYTRATDSLEQGEEAFEHNRFETAKWRKVDVPHNWDEYEGYRRLRHGNRHGYAYYTKIFTVKPQPADKKYFLYFEGVGSYATVWLNGKQVGYHAGGRTTFTLDLTNAIKLNNQSNFLAVRADHPANIKDLPWVCGGCSDERGFSEGSQPMGIFRPVHLIITNNVRVQPFGVHIWNDKNISSKSAQLYFETEVKNYSTKPANINLVSKLIDHKGSTILEATSTKKLNAGEVVNIHQQPSLINHPHLWSLDDPYLYTLVTEVIENGKVVDKTTTPYGIRWIQWQIGKGSSHQFLLNGSPVFINGIAEYEHLIGNSHAFTAEQIRSRVKMMKAAGFNAFRDAHHPHNLRYQQYWDEQGWLWWPQMSAHVWYDTPEFRTNFKKLLADWVKERRNDPSNIMWGLQNESKLPEDFAKECTALIRQLDPTASSQRLVTTCNGGQGTDWDVPQNWTGTYGGDPLTYAEDIKRQILVGEYGAWRTLDLHAEGPFKQDGAYSEDRMTQLMEMKVRLAEAAKDSAAGHFLWIFSSHDNPGRVQGGEGYRELDRVGPVNYKGLLTPWEEPLDVYYMYRSNYAPKDKEPMVYIASHTWPSRWTTTGKKDGIVVYSNCDEVELFNDMHSLSLGKRKKSGIGTHFTWNDVDIKYNVLYAVGYVHGKEVARDYIVLNHLPQSPNFSQLYKHVKPVTKAQPNYHYIYRVNCGGPEYKDENGNVWLADRALPSNVSNDTINTWGSSSWTSDFAGYPPFFASQRRTFDPIKGTRDWKLFQTFRYGREKLQYKFPVPDGEYLVELYFIEPWLGTGGGMNAPGMRLFDVAINDRVVLKDVDIWKEAGHDAAMKRTVKAAVRGGLLTISFPRVAAGQAVISAIAIASSNKTIQPAKPSPSIIQNLKVNDEGSSFKWSIQSWLDIGDEQYSNTNIQFTNLSPELFGAEWIRSPKDAFSTALSLASFDVSNNADVYVAFDTITSAKPGWLKDFEDTKSIVSNSEGNVFRVYKKRFSKGDRVILNNQPVSKSMYSVFVNPTSAIEPAYDLKPVTTYKAFNATLKGSGLVKGQVDGKDRAIFEKPSNDNAVEWHIVTGVADTYSFTISYNNPTSNIIKGSLQLLSADGTLMKEEAIEFTPTRPGKSNYINSGSGSMINAGHYIVRLTSKEAQGLSINSLDVQ